MEAPLIEEKPVVPLRRLSLLILFPMLLLCGPVYACSLDGVPSLSANGHLAGLTQGTATRATIAYWARFTLPAAAPGTSVRFQEDLTNVRRSLSSASLATPFHWRFGDGAIAQGYSVTHRYARRGWYRVTVSYLWPTAHRWVVFDTAQLEIVAPSDLLRTNLRYYLAEDIQTALRFALWGLAAGLLGWLGWKKRFGIARNVPRR